MRSSYTELYLHCVWATWDRLPLVTRQVEEQLYASIATKCRELRCEPLAIGGIDDHIHLVVSLSPTVAMANLVGEVKGTSSHLMTHVLRPGVFFKWQGAYGAFTVSKSVVPSVVEYVRNQKDHHQNNRLIPELEVTETDANVFDDDYVSAKKP